MKQPVCPPGLSAEVQSEFERLASLQKLRPEAGDLLAMLAQVWITWRKATATVEAQGEIVMSGGTAISNPSLAVAAQAQRQIMEITKTLKGFRA